MPVASLPCFARWVVRFRLECFPVPWAWERSGSLSSKTASTTCWSFAMASETDEGLLSVSTPCVTVLTALGVLISLKDTARGGVLVWPLLAVALGPFPPAGVGPLRLLAPKFVDKMLDSPIFGAAVSALIPSFASFLGALPSL